MSKKTRKKARKHQGSSHHRELANDAGAQAAQEEPRAPLPARSTMPANPSAEACNELELVHASREVTVSASSSAAMTDVAPSFAGMSSQTASLPETARVIPDAPMAAASIETSTTSVVDHDASAAVHDATVEDRSTNDAPASVSSPIAPSTEMPAKPASGWRRALGVLERMISGTAATTSAPVPPPIAMDASAGGAATISLADVSEPAVDASQQKPCALWGHVSVLTVPDVLGLLSTLRKTGIFSVWNEREWYRIWIVSGTVVWAQSRTPMPNLMIGQILVAQGSIDQASLAQFIEQRPESRSRLGRSLVEVGRIGAQDLERAVTFQAQSIFDRAYAMQDASYNFELGATPGGDEHGLSVTHLLLESARSSDEAMLRQTTPPASHSAP